ncbi:Anoctamin-1 [Armadillidium vulgare]|nr:Anoctamin-1 [Armadillidium vulgare]
MEIFPKDLLERNVLLYRSSIVRNLSASFIRIRTWPIIIHICPNIVLFNDKCILALTYEWGRGLKWYKRQPLHVIRRYFGDKMALYFAWLGFYTEMLIPAALMGIFTFVCGIFFVYSDYNKPSDEICDDDLAGNTTMCPLCDGACFFKKLSDSCMNSKIAFLFDNPMTVLFSIGMSFWVYGNAFSGEL